MNKYINNSTNKAKLSSFHTKEYLYHKYIYNADCELYLVYRKKVNFEYPKLWNIYKKPKKDTILKNSIFFEFSSPFSYLMYKFRIIYK